MGKAVLQNYFSLQKVNNLLILLFVFCTSGLIAQAPVFTVRVKLSVVDGDLKSSVITITKNGSPFRVIDPDKGKYTVDLDLGAEYLFTATKLGYIAKSVVVDTHIPNGREKEEFAKFLVEVELTKQPEDQEISYSQPVGRIKYTNEMDDFDFDKDYTATAKEMQKKADANPIPKPKPPTPNPRPAYTPPVQPTLGSSKPIPIEVKQPTYTPEPTKKKPVEVIPDKPQKTIVKNRTEKIIQEDRRKITLVTINIDGVDYLYKKEQFDWGGLFYYKDGKPITERTFDKETE